MAIKKSILSYLGVVAPTPPNFLYLYRAPTVNDYKDYRIGCLWLVKNTEFIYMLTDKKAGVATWTLLSGGGTGTITQIDGGVNITTVNPTGPTVTVNLDDNITLAGDLTLTTGDATIASLAEGVVQSDASGLLFANSGADGQVIVGNSSGAADWYTLTSAEGSVIFTTGAGTLDLRATGGGGGGLSSNPTDSGTATVSASGAIDILGGVNINTVASGASIVSINLDNDVSLSGSFSAGTTITAGTGLTVSSLSRGVVQSSSTGVFSSSEGSDGEVLISSSSGAPAWSSLTAGANVTITPGPNSVTIAASGSGGGGLIDIPTDSGTATISAANAISLLGGSNIGTIATGASEITVNLNNTVSVSGSISAGTSLAAGTTVSATGNINSVSGSVSAGTTMTAAGNITTTGGNLVANTGDLTLTAGSATIGDSATVANTLTLSSLGAGVVQSSAAGVLSSSNGTNGQVLIGGAATPIWANLTSTGGTITFTPGAGTLNLEASGGGGVLAGDNLNIAPVGTINLNKSIIQPKTNSTGTEGLYSLGSSRFMHNYGYDTRNTFLGVDSGNFTLNVSGDSTFTAWGNTGIGYNSLKSLTRGGYNTAVGAYSLTNFTEWAVSPRLNFGYNTGIGYNTLSGLVNGQENTALGYNAGSSLTGSDWGNICIGHTGGSGYRNHTFIGTDAGDPYNPNRCVVAGIYDTVPNLSSTPRIMQVGDNNLLGVVYGKAQGTVLMGQGSFSDVDFGTLTSSSNTIIIDTSTPGNINLEYTGAAISAFRAYQTVNLANMTGDGTYYWLGASAALSEEYDIGGDFYPGSGSGVAASFVAPFDGLYNFTVSILLTNLEVPPPPPSPPPSPVYLDPVSIVTSSRTYELVNPALVYSGEQTLFYTVFAKMDAGHNAFFNCAIITDYLTKTVGIGATHTWIGGFLVSAGI